MCPATTGSFREGRLEFTLNLYVAGSEISERIVEGTHISDDLKNIVRLAFQRETTMDHSVSAVARDGYARLLLIKSDCNPARFFQVDRCWLARRRETRSVLQSQLARSKIKGIRG